MVPRPPALPPEPANAAAPYFIAPVALSGPSKYDPPQTLHKSVEDRHVYLYYPLKEEFSGFKRFCAARVASLYDLPTFYGVFVLVSGLMALATGMANAVGSPSDHVAVWVPFLLCSPGVLHLAAMWMARGHKKKVLPPWLRTFHDRNAKEFAAIMTEAEAFNTWARTARIPPEMQADVTIAADARRKGIHDRMLAYLAGMDRVLEHRKEVDLLLTSRTMVDAAFPESDPRFTLAVAPRVAMLHTAETLLDEAIELGMPTEEILDLRRQLPSGS